MQNNYWILMGDIIKSRKKSSVYIAEVFYGLVNYLNNKFQDKILSPLTVTLGDEFQGVIQSKKDGIELIIEAEEWLLHENIDLKIRYVLNFGKIETEINSKIAYGMLGIGLTETREKLNNLKKKKEKYWVGVADKPDEKINKLLFLFQSFTNDWNQEQRKIASLFLKFKDYKMVATTLGKHQSLLWRREKKLKIKEYEIIKQLLKAET